VGKPTDARGWAVHLFTLCFPISRERGKLAALSERVPLRIYQSGGGEASEDTKGETPRSVGRTALRGAVWVFVKGLVPSFFRGTAAKQWSLGLSRDIISSLSTSALETRYKNGNVLGQEIE